MVAELIEAGCAPEVAASVVARAFVSGVSSGGFRADAKDESAEKRRAWDRERKQLQRHLRLPQNEWISIVSDVLKRDGHKCTYCDSMDNLTADHVVPLTRGGSNHLSNLTACCIPCNTKKSNKLISEWLPAASVTFHADVHPNPPDTSSGRKGIVVHPTSTRIHPNPPDVANTPLSSLESNNRKRGARLPESWLPSSADRAFAKDLGWSESQVDAEAANFRDYWIARPGSGGCKLDWPATWRKWVRSSKVKPAGPPPASADAQISGFYAKADSEQLGAWDRWAIEKRGKGMPRDRNGGWRVEAEWPPGYVPIAESHYVPPPKFRSMS